VIGSYIPGNEASTAHTLTGYIGFSCTYEHQVAHKRLGSLYLLSTQLQMKVADMATSLDTYTCSHFQSMLLLISDTGPHDRHARTYILICVGRGELLDQLTNEFLPELHNEDCWLLHIQLHVHSPDLQECQLVTFDFVTLFRILIILFCIRDCSYFVLGVRCSW